MALHPDFPASPYAPLLPSERWFPADEALREKSYDKLLPPLVAKIRQAVFEFTRRPIGPSGIRSISPIERMC